MIGGHKHGAEIISSEIVINGEGKDLVVDMQRSFLPYVTFEEIAIGAGPASLEFHQVLEVCTEAVKSIVIPAFVWIPRHSGRDSGMMPAGIPK